MPAPASIQIGLWLGSNKQWIPAGAYPERSRRAGTTEGVCQDRFKSILTDAGSFRRILLGQSVNKTAGIELSENPVVDHLLDLEFLDGRIAQLHEPLNVT